MKKINLLLFAAAVVSLSSCLKDGRVNLAPGASPPVVEWSTAVIDLAPKASVVGTPYILYGNAYPIQSSVTQNMQVGYTGGENTKSDIGVNVTVDAAALQAYNVANFGSTTANYYVDPTGLYTVQSSTTIPAGTSKGTVALTFNTAGFDLTKKYAIALKISSISGTSAQISGNYGTIILSVAAKNKWDGIWTMNGTLVDLSTGSIVGKYPQKIYLETQGPNTDAMFDYVSIGTFAHVISSGGSTSYYGSFAPVFQFDANNNVTAVTNYYGQPASNGRSGAIDPSGTNKFTSGTPGTVGAVFQSSYFMNQPSVIAVGPRTTFNETFTYVGPRP